jgi:uncharacterized protein (TIGR03083 family)
VAARQNARMTDDDWGAPAALPWAPADYLGPLAAEMAAFEAVVAANDPEAQVPVSRSWKLRGLASHLGGIHRWAAENVRTGVRSSLVPQLPDGADPARWYREGADILLDTLGSADYAAPCWNFTKMPRVTGFWTRRQLHETTIHGRDADLAFGPPRAIEPILAADGVDEVLRSMLPVAHRWGNRMPPQLPGAVLMRLSDTGHTWLLTPNGEPVPTVDGPDAEGPDGRRSDLATSAVITVTGRAEDVLLLLWQRTDLATSAVTVDGDAAAIGAFIGGQITP